MTDQQLDDLDEVVARLKGTMDEEDNEKRAEGHADGVAWARKWATMSELRYIATEFEPGTGGDFQADSSVVTFTAAKDGENYVSIGHAEGDPYWEGFIDGAAEVLRAVEPRL